MARKSLLHSPAAKRYLKLSLLGAFLVFIAFVGWQSYVGNFYEVIPDELYRSAQLSPEQLAERIDQHQIRSVLNLRGPAPDQEWYRNEVATAHAHGAHHADFELSAGTALDQQQMDDLIAQMAALPKPLLVHCWGGADRTGLATALYLYKQKHQPAEQAAEQLSLRYGHLPYFIWSRTKAMDESFEQYLQSAPHTP